MVGVSLDYRRARESDIPSIAKVFATAINDVSIRHGFSENPVPPSPPNPQYAFWLKKDPGAFWVAESEGRVIGYTFSFLRGSLWFLADLFILPEHQGKGVGGALIRKTLGSWRGRRIDNRALITPAFNRASVSLYMRYGMLPRQPVYVASAPRKAVELSLKGKANAELEADEPKVFRTVSPELDRVHTLALGFPSGWHNQFFFEVLKARCLVFRKKGRPEGYSFVSPSGKIGPLVVRSAGSFAAAFDLTLRAAVEGDQENVSMYFPGTNGAAASLSIKHGLRIVYPMLFLSSRSLGDFENYLFFSAGLM